MNDFDQRLRTAVRASFAEVDVPRAPSFQTRQGMGEPAWIAVAAAVIIAVSITIGKQVPAIAQTLENGVSFFVRSGNATAPVPVSALTFSDALATRDFYVLRPAGLPSGATFASAQRVASASGSSLVAFRYGVRGRTLNIIESSNRLDDRWKQDAHEAGAPDSKVGFMSACPNRICSDHWTTFRAHGTIVTIAGQDGALSQREIDAIEAAMQREAVSGL